MAQPSVYEQLEIELINRARQNPDAELARYNSDNPTKTISGLNDSLAAGTINSDPKQPLVFNPLLIEAARSHSQWMLDTDIFSHTQDGTGLGVTRGNRYSAVGYPTTSGAENISWIGTTGTPNVPNFVIKSYDGLFGSSGHRRNMLNNNYHEVGIGILEGVFTDDGTNFNAVMTTQNFGSANPASYLTGVAFSDLVTDDDFYTVGEGLRGIVVTAVNQVDKKSYTTTTMDAGGYQLALDPGTYDLTFSFVDNIIHTVSSVTIGSENVKVDLNTDFIVDRTDLDNSSTLSGTSVEDILLGSASDQNISGLDGQDTIYGAEGNDVIWGGNDADLLVGGEGNDKVIGGNGNDVITGVYPFKANPGLGEVDILRGQAGEDIFVLGDGSDVYYNYGGTRAEGLADKAVIRDFSLSEDKILLHGNPNNYNLKVASWGSLIFYRDANSGISELIATVPNVSGLNLFGSEFIYLDDSPLLTGRGADDILSGGSTNQTIRGLGGSDFLLGGGGSDTLLGANGNDNLVGGLGDDFLFGGNGNDFLNGVDTSYINPELGEIRPGYGEEDLLNGGAGIDFFVLGDLDHGVYYNHGGTEVEGLQDQAIIRGFNAAEDQIVLNGTSGTYSLQEISWGTKIIYHENGSTVNELIATVAGVNDLDLANSNYFQILD